MASPAHAAGAVGGGCLLSSRLRAGSVDGNSWLLVRGNGQAAERRLRREGLGGRMARPRRHRRACGRQIGRPLAPWYWRGGAVLPSWGQGTTTPSAVGAWAARGLVLQQPHAPPHRAASEGQQAAAAELRLHAPLRGVARASWHVSFRQNIVAVNRLVCQHARDPGPTSPAPCKRFPPGADGAAPASPDLARCGAAEGAAAAHDPAQCVCFCGR